MSGARSATRAVRAFVIFGVWWFCIAGFLWAVGVDDTTLVPLALYGFVFHVLFGKAYTLIPAYFDRELAFPMAPTIHLPLAVTGTAGLTMGRMYPDLGVAGRVGTLLWAAGAIVFLGTILLTIRSNLSGAETATGSSKPELRQTDRIANGFVPVALAYFLIGIVESIASVFAVPSLTIGLDAQIAHVFGAGTASLLVFAIGTRLLPRFFVATPPLGLVWIVLVTGNIGPLSLVMGLQGGVPLAVAGAMQATAIGAYTVLVTILWRRSSRSRVAYPIVVSGGVLGVIAAGVGLTLVLSGPNMVSIALHARLMLFGFLGLTILGVLCQFYPPAIGTGRLYSDRTAQVGAFLIGGGLLTDVVGTTTGLQPLSLVASVAVFVGGCTFAMLFTGLTLERARS